MLEPGIGGSTLDDAKAFAFLNVGFWVFRMWMGSVSSCSCDIVETVETTDSLFLWIGDNCVLGVNVPAAYRSSLLLSVPMRKGDLKLFPFILERYLAHPGKSFRTDGICYHQYYFFIIIVFITGVIMVIISQAVQV